MKPNTAFMFIFLWVVGETASNDNVNLTLYKEPNYEGEPLMNVHSRKKRYIVFPKGSSLQLLLELLVHVPTQFRVVVGPTLQVAWPLPSDYPEDIRQERPPHGENSNLKRRDSHFKQFLKTNNSSTGKQPLGKKNKIFSNLAALLDLFGITVGLAWQLPDDPMIHMDLKKKHKIYKRSVLKKMEAFMRPGGANGRQCVLKALCESGQRTPSKKDFLREILHKIFSMDGEEEEEDFEENHEDKLYRKAHDSMNQNCDALYPECQFSVFNAIQ